MGIKLNRGGAAAADAPKQSTEIERAGDTGLAEYEPMSMDDFAEAVEAEKKAHGAGTKFLSKLPEGETRLRILPPLPGRKAFHQLVYEHRVEMPGVGINWIVCPRRHAEQPCIVCAESLRLRNSGNPIDVKRGEKLDTQSRYYMNVLVRDGANAGPRVWVTGWGTWKDVSAIVTARKRIPCDPETGYDITIVRAGTTQHNTTYTVVAEDSCPLSDDQQEVLDWLAARADLAKYAVPRSAEDIAAILRGEKVERENSGPGGPSRRAVDDARGGSR